MQFRYSIAALVHSTGTVAEWRVHRLPGPVMACASRSNRAVSCPQSARSGTSQQVWEQVVYATHSV